MVSVTATTDSTTDGSDTINPIIVESLFQFWFGPTRGINERLERSSSSDAATAAEDAATTAAAPTSSQLLGDVPIVEAMKQNEPEKVFVSSHHRDLDLTSISVTNSSNLILFIINLKHLASGEKILVAGQTGIASTLCLRCFCM